MFTSVVEDAKEERVALGAAMASSCSPRTTTREDLCTSALKRLNANWDRSFAIDYNEKSRQDPYRIADGSKYQWVALDAI